MLFRSEDTIETELERIKSLLENTPLTDYNQAKEDGFRAAIEFFKNNKIQFVSPDDPLVEEDEKLQKYIREIPISKRARMSIDELFSEAKRMMKNDKNV